VFRSLMGPNAFYLSLVYQAQIATQLHTKGGTGLSQNVPQSSAIKFIRMTNDPRYCLQQSLANESSQKDRATDERLSTVGAAAKSLGN
jgi:hypothetical protein